MSAYIIPNELRFDVDRLVKAVSEVHRIVDRDQINLRGNKNVDDVRGILYGAGSLYDKDKKQFTYEQNFQHYLPVFETNYLTEVSKVIEAVMLSDYGLHIGRARLLTLGPKSNLTYHVDYGAPYRFHVPIITNEDVFYVTNDTVDRMPEVGRLYVYRTDVKHTVVNASRVSRVHLVCSGWK